MKTNTTIFSRNISALRIRFPSLAEKIIAAQISNCYTDSIESKTGSVVPVFKNGTALHSKYNPINEAEKMFSGKEEFVLFCGLGAGVHISVFLNKIGKKRCAVLESDFSDMKALLHDVDFSSIFLNNRVHILQPVCEGVLKEELLQTYIPILDGKFEIKFLRPWECYYKNLKHSILENIDAFISSLKRDISTQAHFGKIWLRNIILNLKTASQISPKKPAVNTKQTAFILGAGPSLEASFSLLKAKREQFVIFATDTAFPVLSKNGITADFFISIDPQIISYSHCFKILSASTIGIFDLCANPLTVKQFIKHGNKFLFTVGSHPFACYAAQYSSFPKSDTKSGTVALSALSAAISLGFSEFKFAGLDFAYTNGKAYSRGTYLSELFSRASTKLSPEETKFTELIFRTDVEKHILNEKITYRSQLLDEYRAHFFQCTENIKLLKTKRNAVFELWTENEFKTFPFREFIRKMESDIKNNSPFIRASFLPYFIYTSKFLDKNTEILFNLELVLSKILMYTEAL